MLLLMIDDNIVTGEGLWKLIIYLCSPRELFNLILICRQIFRPFQIDSGYTSSKLTLS